jgi:hypothetical protein
LGWVSPAACLVSRRPPLLSAYSYAEGVLFGLFAATDGYTGERFVEAKLVEFIIRDTALVEPRPGMEQAEPYTRERLGSEPKARCLL